MLCHGRSHIQKLHCIDKHSRKRRFRTPPIPYAYPFWKIFWDKPPIPNFYPSQYPHPFTTVENFLSLPWINIVYSWYILLQILTPDSKIPSLKWNYKNNCDMILSSDTFNQYQTIPSMEHHIIYFTITILICYNTSSILIPHNRIFWKLIYFSKVSSFLLKYPRLYEKENGFKWTTSLTHYHKHKLNLLENFG